MADAYGVQPAKACPGETRERWSPNPRGIGQECARRLGIPSIYFLFERTYCPVWENLSLHLVPLHRVAAPLSRLSSGVAFVSSRHAKAQPRSVPSTRRMKS